MSSVGKIKQYQVEDGEPVVFVRGNHPLSVKMAIHWAALNSVDRRASAQECADAAKLADDMQEWAKKRAQGAPR